MWLPVAPMVSPPQTQGITSARRGGACEYGQASPEIVSGCPAWEQTVAAKPSRARSSAVTPHRVAASTFAHQHGTPPLAVVPATAGGQGGISLRSSSGRTPGQNSETEVRFLLEGPVEAGASAPSRSNPPARANGRSHAQQRLGCMTPNQPGPGPNRKAHLLVGGDSPERRAFSSQPSAGDRRGGFAGGGGRGAQSPVAILTLLIADDSPPASASRPPGVRCLTDFGGRPGFSSCPCSSTDRATGFYPVGWGFESSRGCYATRDRQQTVGAPENQDPGHHETPPEPTQETTEWEGDLRGRVRRRCSWSRRAAVAERSGGEGHLRPGNHARSATGGRARVRAAAPTGAAGSATPRRRPVISSEAIRP